MTNDDRVRELIAWLRDDDAALPNLGTCHEWADAVEAVLDARRALSLSDESRMMMHRACAATIYAANPIRITIEAWQDPPSRDELLKMSANAVEDIAHALLAAERTVAK